MKQIYNKISLILLSCISLTSCASILRGTTQRVVITSDPSEAEITIDGKYYGHTPQIVTLQRKRAHEVIMAKEGYQTEHLHLEPEVSPMIATNLGLGVLIYTAGLGISCMTFAGIPAASILGVSMAGTGIGMGSDLLLGGGYRLSQNEVHAPLLPLCR